MRRTLLVLMVAVVAVTTVFAQGQFEAVKAAEKYPTKEITIIIPWNPGGTNDLVGRAMQPIFKEMYNVDIVIKNVPGGGSAVGILEAANAKNDGYTLGIATSSFLALMAQGRVEISLDGTSNMMALMEEPIVMVVKNKGKYADAKALIDAVRANPGQISCGVPGSNNVNQAYATLLQERIGSEFNFMPFSGGSRVVAELIGGHIDCGVLKPSETIAQVKAGELKVVGVFNKNGVGVMPDVPTFESLGYDIFRLGNIQHMAYLMGPRGIDPQIQAKIVEMFSAVLRSQAFKKFADETGVQVNIQTGAAFDNYIAEVYAGLEKASAEIFSQ